MSEEALEKLKFPIGRFQPLQSYSPEDIQKYIQRIAALPEKIKAAASGLSDEQLDTPYRDGGWTLRQVIHHVADSHINSFIRFRWTLTENEPTIKAYDQGAWANLSDAKSGPVNLSLDLLHSLHARWVVFLESLTEEDLRKSYIHPETGKAVSLARNLALYAWHGDHHVGHITTLRASKGW